MSFLDIQKMTVTPEQRAVPRETYGPLFDVLWEASGYWWLSGMSLDEVQASCLDNLGFHVADILDGSAYGMEQLAIDLAEGSGKAAGPDLVDVLKEELTRVFGTGEAVAESVPVYDPETVKEIVDYGYDAKDYPPGWWMGYHTRDQVWMFAYSAGAKPGDDASWVARLAGGPRYTGIAPYGDGWWYGLDTVNNEWKYYCTRDPQGPTGHALRSPGGWKTETEYQGLLTGQVQSGAASGDRADVAWPGIYAEGDISEDGRYRLVNGQWARIFEEGQLSDDGRYQLSEGKWIEIRGPLSASADSGLAIRHTVKGYSPEQVAGLRRAGDFEDEIRIPMGGFEMKLSSDGRLWGVPERIPPRANYSCTVVGTFMHWDFDLRGLTSGLPGPGKRILWVLEFADGGVISIASGNWNTVRYDKLNAMALRVKINSNSEFVVAGSGSVTIKVAPGKGNVVDVGRLKVAGVVIEYYQGENRVRRVNW